MRFTCPSCAKSYRLPPERLGAAGRAQISCPNCKALVHVRAIDGDVLECKLAGGQESGAVAVSQGSAAAAVVPIWFVAVGREKQGPFSPLQLGQMVAAGALTGASLVWCKGMQSWTKAQEVPELATVLEAPASPPPAIGRATERQPVPRPTAPQPVGRTSEPQAARPPVAQPIAAATPPPPVAPRPAPPVVEALQAAPEPARPSPVAPSPQPLPAQQQRPVAVEPARAPASQAAPQARPVAPPPPVAQARPQAQPQQQPQQSPRPQSQAVARPAPQANRPSQPAPKVAPRPMATPADLDDAGMTGDMRVIGKGDLRSAVPDIRLAKNESASIHAEAHGAAFFASGHDLNEVELQMPDHNKHKPTKEEYNKLLQEFSVMFRLDKRSKRQKVLIAAVVSLVVLSVIGFGILMVVNGNRKRELISDSKAILAVFSLPYQTAVTVQIETEEKPAVALPGQPAAPPRPAQKRETEVSDLAEKLSKKIARARKPKVAQTGVVLMGLSAEDTKRMAAATHKLSAEELDAQAEALKRMGKSAEKAPGGSAVAGEQVTTEQLRKWCGQQEPSLRGCTASQGGGSFKVNFTVNEEGRVSAVKAFEDGKPADDLTGCARGKMKANFGPQGGKTTDYTCSVN